MITINKSFGSTPSYAFYPTKVQKNHKRKMAPIYTPVSAIVAGKIKLKLNVCVVHIWSIPNFNNVDEECFLHMLLLDDKVKSNQKYFFQFYVLLLMLACFFLLLT
jgi:hypothetical protein